MMNKFIFLIKGELLRLKKYNVITVNVVVTLMWFLLLFLIEDHGLLNQLLPMILMFDVTMMSALYVGASLFFEKSEQTNVTLLVTPLSHHAHVLSKAIVNTIHMVLSSVVLALIFYFVRGVEINFVYLVVTLFVASFVHSLIGFIFSYLSKDFTSMLMLVMAYSLLFMVPTVIREFNIFFTGDVFTYLLLLSPSQASINLLALSIGGELELQSLLSLLSLLVIGLLIYTLIVVPKYKTNTVRQSGV